MTICPNHRLKLGVGWIGVETLDAEFPKQCQDMAKAGKRWPKAEKGLDKDDSLYILETTGVFVAVGSGKYSYSS